MEGYRRLSNLKTGRFLPFSVSRFFLLHGGMIGYFSIIPDLCSRNVARGCSATSLFNSTWDFGHRDVNLNLTFQSWKKLCLHVWGRVLETLGKESESTFPYSVYFLLQQLFLEHPLNARHCPSCLRCTERTTEDNASPPGAYSPARGIPGPRSFLPQHALLHQASPHGARCTPHTYLAW